MDVTKILEQLREERDQLEAAIVTLERLALGRGKRRGRPPSWMVEARKRTKSGDEVSAAEVIEAAVAANQRKIAVQTALGESTVNLEAKTALLTTALETEAAQALMAERANLAAALAAEKLAKALGFRLVLRGKKLAVDTP